LIIYKFKKAANKAAFFYTAINSISKKLPIWGIFYVKKSSSICIRIKVQGPFPDPLVEILRKHILFLMLEHSPFRFFGVGFFCPV